MKTNGNLSSLTPEQRRIVLSMAKEPIERSIFIIAIPDDEKRWDWQEGLCRVACIVAGLYLVGSAVWWWVK